MIFRLDRVIPQPLADSPVSDRSIWRTVAEIKSDAITIAEAPSGTGKTTLLSMLYGVRHDYDGTVTLDSENIRGYSIEKWGEIRRDKISVVFQDLRLFPQLTSMQNILIKNQLRPTLQEDEIRAMAVELGVDHRLETPCGKLSLGQQQRIAVIRALAQPFSFLLLDEPFSHLDHQNSKKVTELVLKHCEKNKAGLLMTSLGPSDMFPFNEVIYI